MTLILGHLLAIAMAGIPSLHHWLHGDAASPDHSCAVTAVLAGQIDHPDACGPAITPARFLVTDALPFTSGQRPSGAPRTSGRERAPPAA